MKLTFLCGIFGIACLLSSCAASTNKNARTLTDYSGQDRGTVVIGIGARKGTNYDGIGLRFRRIGQNTAPPFFSYEKSDPARYVEGNFVYFQNNIFFKEQPDFLNETEAGIVHVASLPPGRYEIFKVEAYLGGGGFFSKEPFSIPFEVSAGKTTYLGNYQANRTPIRKFLGIPGDGGPYFVVSSRMTSEVVIANKKQQIPAQGVNDAMPNVDLLRIGFFVSRPLSD